MGIALISLTNVIDPEMFVIGGGVSRSWALVQPTMLETLRSSPFIKPARRPACAVPDWEIAQGRWSRGMGSDQPVATFPTRSCCAC